MKTAIGLVGLAAVAMLLFSYQSNSEGSQLFLSKMLDADEQAYLGWISEFGKSYPTKEEYKFRFQHFKRHLDEIKAHDEKYYGIQVGLNVFSDNTEEEWKKMRGLILPKNFEFRQDAVPEDRKEEVKGMPAAVDWRNQSAVTPVKNQGRCGSCWAFSAVAAMESDYQNKHGTLRNFSEQQIVDCVKYNATAKQSCCWGCAGGFMTPSWQWLMDENQGAVPSEKYPYKGTDKDQCQRFNASDDQGFVDSYDGVDKNAEMLKLRLQHKVLAVAIEAENTWFRNYKGGIITKGCGQNLDHAVAAVGYGVTAAGQEYFIVKNSWGATWGEAGYVRIAPDQCGITQWAVSVNMNY